MEKWNFCWRNRWKVLKRESDHVAHILEYTAVIYFTTDGNYGQRTSCLAVCLWNVKKLEKILSSYFPTFFSGAHRNKDFEQSLLEPSREYGPHVSRAWRELVTCYAIMSCVTVLRGFLQFRMKKTITRTNRLTFSCNSEFNSEMQSNRNIQFSVVPCPTFCGCSHVLLLLKE